MHIEIAYLGGIMKLVSLMTTFAVTAGIGLPALAAGCDGILSLTRNLTFEQKSIRVAQNIYSQYCSGSTVKSGSEFSLGLDVVIEQVPIGLNLGSGSTKEKVEHLCSQYSSWYASNSASVSLAISTSDKAIDAWVSCQELEKQDVFFSVNPQKELVGFGVRRGTDVIDFLGMDYVDAHLSCFGPFGKDGKQILIDRDTRFTLSSSKEQPITCRRSYETKDGIEYLASSEVSISAEGRPPLIIPLPREEKYEPSFASEIKNSITSLDARLSAGISKTEQNVAKLRKRVAAFTKNLDVDTFIVTYGDPPRKDWHDFDHAWVGCGSLDAKAKRICKHGVLSQADELTHFAGGKCGYVVKRYTCLKKKF